MSKQEELVTDPNVTQFTKLDAKGNASDAGNDQSMFVLTKKNQRNQTKLFLRKRKILIKDGKL